MIKEVGDLRPNGNHSFADRLSRADIMGLSVEHLRIAVLADSPNSADRTCIARGIRGQTRKRIGAVAQILRDYPEKVFSNPDRLLEMEKLREVIEALPAAMRQAIWKKMDGRIIARSLEDNAGKGGV